MVKVKWNNRSTVLYYQIELNYFLQQRCLIDGVEGAAEPVIRLGDLEELGTGGDVTLPLAKLHKRLALVHHL